MPYFDIVKQSKIETGFKSRAIKDRYDLQTDSVQERFSGDFDLPDEWQIGIIAGPSGSGKTTIMNEMFDVSDISFDESRAVIEQFSGDLKNIENILRSVGFASVPSWLKPYGTLSNGEKMRVTLAKALHETTSPIVFDEYTSVVDRHIACVGSMAVNKAIRRTDKQFVAVTCHYDIIEWLQPDWIFDTATYKMSHTRGLHRRPDIRLEVYKCRGYWPMFKRYHYLSEDLHKAATQYVGFVEGKPVAFVAVMHQPHSVSKNLKRISRIVVDPEWQGVGIGRHILEYVSQLYTDKGYRVRIVTSNPMLTQYFNRSEKWVIDRKGRSAPHSDKRYSRPSISTIGAEYIVGIA